MYTKWRKCTYSPAKVDSARPIYTTLFTVQVETKKTYSSFLLSVLIRTKASCYNNGSESPHRRRRTNNFIVFAKWRQWAASLMPFSRLTGVPNRHAQCRSQWASRIACPSAVWENPGSNLTADGCVYRDGHCDMQLWAQAAPLLQCLGQLRLASLRSR